MLEITKCPYCGGEIYDKQTWSLVDEGQGKVDIYCKKSCGFIGTGMIGYIEVKTEDIKPVRMR